MDALLRFERFQPLQNGATPPLRVGPDPCQKLPRQSLRASSRQLRAIPATVLQLASHHAPQTDEPWDVEKHHGIACRETNIQRATVIAIHDPGRLAHERFDLRAPLLGRGRIPARPPVEGIEMDEREVGARGEASGECRFAGPAAADDEDALQRRDWTQRL